MGILGLLVGLTGSAVQRARAAAARAQCLNNLRQLGIGLHNYHSARGVLPPGHTSRAGVPDNYRELGWQARLLPYLDQQPLWVRVEEAFRVAPLAGPRQPPHGAILATLVPVFACPSDPRSGSVQSSDNGIPVALCSYLGNEGLYYAWTTGVLFGDSAVKLTDITDGTSQTLLVGERPASADNSFGWWYRGYGQQDDGSADFVLGVRERNALGGRYKCPPGPYRFTPGSLQNQCDMLHFWSLHPGGGNFLFADGAVRFLGYSADSVMPALASRAGGEPVALPE